MQLQKSGDNAKMMELQQKAQALGAEYSTSVENLMNLADSRAAQACESEVIPATELIPATPWKRSPEEEEIVACAAPIPQLLMNNPADSTNMELTKLLTAWCTCRRFKNSRRSYC